MKVCVPVISAFEQGGGDAFGYSTARKLAIRALNEVGVEVTEDKNCEYDYLIWYCSPHFFTPVAGRKNYLFTMWEAEDLPYDIYVICRQAEAIIVPSRFSKDVLKRAGYPKKIKVCNQAVDTEFYTYKEKSKKDIFRVLWLGAPNIRKGFDSAVKAFHTAFLDSGYFDKVELYMKSSLYESDGSYTYNSDFHVHFDTRRLSREDLRELYYSSDVLLYPSRGEGAGLIPMESMSCGTPVISTRFSGLGDYINKAVAYPVEYDLINVSYGVKTKMAEARLKDLVKWLLFCYENPEDVFFRGKRASDFIKNGFSIKIMGERMKKILAEV